MPFSLDRLSRDLSFEQPILLKALGRRVER